ncbi:small nucleolar ribonucleoprotein complex subunit Utp14 [Histoplasma capsulatum var. duboisii H88]|uniref:Small nucleolar ribonucleoprotein complex subunit Utp14 n=1 Tax=Ajellomyces capsulatus (strain H88) TaxID=544711 RepID=F0UUU7_AJEC8|nr:small nucleolar ribonucleoprotein complex subunit Utp14 [Histoplasma capsulatum var. duboisii H88]
MARKSNQLRSKEEPRRSKPKGTKKPYTRGGLDALTVAEKQYPLNSGIRKHRLGVEGDDGSKRKRGGPSRLDSEGDSHDPPFKRRRTGDDDEGSDSSGNRGSDSEGNEWLLGRVDSDDDSDIDSDEAMGESDEENFDGRKVGGSAKAKVKSTLRNRDTDDFNLSEGDGEALEDDDDLGEEAVDLATAWDMNAEDTESDVKANTTRAKKTLRSKTTDEEDNIDTTGSEGEDQEGDSDDSDGDDASDVSGLSLSDEGDSNERGLSKLQKFVKSMENGQSDEGKSKPKHQTITHGAQPTEFGLMPTRKLTVADLIPTISDSRMKGSLKHLDAVAATKKSKAGIPGKLQAPLAKRQQDRIDRAAAYEKSKETLNRWIETVKANRRADHLSFPLPEPNAIQQSSITDSKPLTDLESTIQNILVESGLADEKDKSSEARIQEFEELQAKKLPLEEIQARRAELRKARELLFREEVRAKRIKKIKSKSYRRVHRKEREKMDIREREALIAAGVDVDEEDREKLDRQRAEARMGAKHRESKWAKGLKQTGRTAWDDEARLEMADLARRGEELQSRIEGKRVTTGQEGYLGSSSEESESDSDAAEDGFGSDAEAQHLKKKLNDLDQNGNENEEPITGPHAGLLSMKFMRNAEAARKAQNDAEIKKLRREMDGGDDLHSDDEMEMAAIGRQKFGRLATTNEPAVTAPQRQEFEEPDSDADDKARAVESDGEIEIQVDNPTTNSNNSNHRAHKSTARSSQPLKKRSPLANNHATQDDNADVDNPWLTQPKRNAKKHNGSSPDAAAEISLISNGAMESDPSTSRLLSVAPKHAKSSAKGNPSATKSRDQPAEAATATSDNGDDGSDDGEGGGNTRVPVLLKNADLVKRAFAGDEVLADFSKEKRNTAAEEGDQIIDTTLPGWGSWAGAGLTKREKQQAKARRSFVTEEGVKAEKRRDARLDRVIVNEKRVRKNTKYLASQLPHPFESRQQYERSLRLPIGPEWTTKETFQNATKPRVMLKQGVIKPLQRPLL